MKKSIPNINGIAEKLKMLLGTDSPTPWENMTDKPLRDIIENTPIYVNTAKVLYFDI